MQSFRHAGTVLFLIAVSVLYAPSVHAQSLSDGSIYSRFGLGERASFQSSQSQAMGGGGTALGSFRYGNLANPAGLSDQYFTRVNGGMIMERLTASETGQQDALYNSGQFNAVHITFPIRARKTGLGFGFSPFSNVNYRVDETSLLETDPEDGTLTPQTTSYKGNGGLQLVSAAVGQTLTPKLSVGLSARFVFGILEESQRTVFNNTRFDDTSVVRSTRLKGFSPVIGIRYNNTDFPGIGRPLAFGLAVTLPSTLSGERALVLNSGTRSDTLETAVSGDIDIPLQFAAGLSFQPSIQWTVVADVQYEGWSSLSSDFSLPGITPTNDGLQDRVRMSTGIEFWPGARRPFGPYLVRMAYRMGVYADESYVSPDPSERIRTIGITGGLSVPTAIPGTTIDLNLDVGRRGTTTNGLVKDRFIRFGININFGERWFDRLPLG